MAANPQAKRAMQLSVSRCISLKRAWAIVKGGAAKAGGAARRVKKSLWDIDIGTGVEGYLVLDGMREGLSRGYDRYRAGTFKLDRWTFNDTFLPMADGMVTAGLVHRGRASKLTAPAVKNFFAARPLRGDFSKILGTNLGEIVDGAPSALGWLEGARQFRANRAVWASQTRTPRLAALTGVQVQVSGSGSAIRLAGNRATVVDSAAARIAVGGVVYRGVHAVRTSKMVPAPVKRVFSLSVTG